MKKIFALLFMSLIYWNCGTTVDTANLGPVDRLNYATKLYNDEDYDLAIKEYEAILLQYPGNEIADQAQFFLGQSRFQRKEYILAAYEYSKLIKTMTASKFVPEAQYKLASCYYQLSPNFSIDQKYTKKAIEELQAFIDFFPADQRVADAEAKITELQNKLAEKEYHSGYIYEKMEYNNAAIMCYSKVTETYHDSKFAPMASYRKINLLVARQKFNEALLEIDQFISKYPKDEQLQDVISLKKDIEQKLASVN